jgi:hypothetical protein
MLDYNYEGPIIESLHNNQGEQLEMPSDACGSRSFYGFDGIHLLISFKLSTLTVKKTQGKRCIYYLKNI